MKRNLLFASLLLGAGAIAQITNGSNPLPGTSQTMYILDSNVTNYLSTVGNNVTWDYSTTQGYSSTSTVEIAYETASSSDFPSATHSLVVPGFISRYLVPTAASLHSEGFVYQDITVGSILVQLNTDNQKVMDYPFAYNASTSDAFAGVVFGGPLPTPTPCTGTSTTTIDGTGTLKLNGVDFTNVYRVKSTIAATANLGLLGDVQLNNTQFDYYDTLTTKLPIFSHSTIDLIIAGGQPNSQSLVLSRTAPSYLGMENPSLEFAMFPNPATEELSIAGLSGETTLAIFNMEGKEVLSAVNNTAVAKVNVSSLTPGVYSVRINGEKGTGVQRLVIQ